MSLSIRFSEILTRLKCRKKHKYEYIDELEPTKLDDRILVGLWGHAAIKCLLLGGSHDEARNEIAQEMEKYFGKRTIEDLHLDMANLALSCAEEAVKRLNKKYTPIMIEEQMKYVLPIYMGDKRIEVTLTGTPDFVAQEKETGLSWLFDHKFRNQFRLPEAEQLNLQMTHYTYMLKKTKDIEVVGSKQFQIKPVLPKTPEITAKGKISRKPITSDWETYSAAVTANGENLIDYLDMRDKLDGKVFYDMDSATAIRSWEEVDKVFNSEIIPVVKEIIHARETCGSDSYRCWDFGACNFCHYRSYCVADLKGEDLEYLRKSQFKKKGETLQVVEIDMEG